MKLTDIKAFQSSLDATKLSNTVKGAIIASSSVIILLASVFLHTSLDSNQIANFADQVAQTISAVGVAIGLIHTLYGVLIKIGNVVVTSLYTPRAVTSIPVPEAIPISSVPVD